MSELVDIEGEMVCHPGFLVLPECLGETFEARAARFPLTVTLPRLDQGRHSYNLIAPYSKSRAGQDAIDAAAAQYPGDSEWGCVQTWRDPDDWEEPPIPTSVLVERLRFSTIGDADDDDQLQNTIDHFAADQTNWWANLADWIGIVSSQDLIRLGRNHYSESFERLAMWASREDGQVSGFIKPNFGRLNTDTGKPLTRADLASCINLASQRDRPPDEWLLIRDARSLLNSGEYRRAVIDAGTAAELTLTALLEDYLRSSDGHLAANDKSLLARSETLGGRTKLASELIPEKLPSRLQQEVTQPRNVAAHKNDSLSEETAAAAIAKAVELVQNAYPLDQYGFERTS